MGSGTRSIRKGAGDPARRNQDPGRTDPDPGRHLAGLAAVLRDSPVHRSVPRPADRRQDRDARTDRAGRQEPWPQSTLLAAIPHLPRAPGAWELRFLLRPDAAGVTDPVVGHACHSIPRAGRSGDLARHRDTGRGVWRPATTVVRRCGWPGYRDPGDVHTGVLAGPGDLVPVRVPADPGQTARPPDPALRHPAVPYRWLCRFRSEPGAVGLPPDPAVDHARYRIHG